VHWINDNEAHSIAVWQLKQHSIFCATVEKIWPFFAGIYCLTVLDSKFIHFITAKKNAVNMGW